MSVKDASLGPANLAVPRHSDPEVPLPCSTLRACDLFAGLLAVNIPAVVERMVGGLEMTVESIVATPFLPELQGTGVGRGPPGRRVDLTRFGRPVELRWRKHRWTAPAVFRPALVDPRRPSEAFGFRRFAHYRTRAVLDAGKPNWHLRATVIPR